MLVADPLQTRGFDHQSAGTLDHEPSRLGQSGEALAAADKYRDPELVFELPDLLADARLRREQHLGGIRDIQAMIYNGYEITQLLQIHRIRLSSVNARL